MDGAPSPFPTSLGRNLRAGIKLLVLKRLAPGDLIVTFDQLVGLFVIDLLVYVTLDAWYSGSGTQLALDGLIGWPCYLLIGLSACAIVARTARPEAPTRAVLVPLLSVAPYVLLLLHLVSELEWVRGWPLAAGIVALVYLAILSVRITQAAFGDLSRRVVITSVLTAVVASVAVAALDLETTLWAEGDSDTAAAEADNDTTEPLLYDQPARIAAAVQRVAPAEAGAPAVFFVGFAGDGDQAVFKREALLAQQQLAAHFDAERRSLLLINDVEDRDSYPIASVTGLQQALKLLAARMDRDRDMLVLMLSSHGSPDGLAVSNGSLPLLTLEPADLREALDASGIRWRVLVVSACYAGVFLEPLKSETTALVTASDAEHSSFGCDDSHDVTDFGQAFLKDALPGSRTLEEAFGKAARLINERETSAHEEHSNPQLYIGPQIRAKLVEIESAAGRSRQRAFVVRR